MYCVSMYLPFLFLSYSRIFIPSRIRSFIVFRERKQRNKILTIHPGPETLNKKYLVLPNVTYLAKLK